MKTPFTDAVTLIVHAGGKALPVTPASVTQMMEVRKSALEVSQDIAWGLIKLVDWKHQSDEWKEAARNWQTDVYVHKELPLYYEPGHKPADPEDLPTNMSDAIRLIAALREERHRETLRLAELEREADALAAIVEKLETAQHDIANITKSFQQN